MNLSVRDLEAFLALADTQHFTRAAERCHLSQSAFSQKIARIERAAGVRLFERSTRQVALTPEGQAFAEEVRRIRSDLQHALASLQDLTTRRVGKVAVAALPSAAAVWMPPVIARYRAAWPQVRVQLFDALAQHGLDLLRAGAVDLAITAGGDLREFDLVELKQERFWLVCPPGHALAGKRHVTLRQLQGQEVVHLARSSSVRQRLEAAWPDALGQPGALEVEHLATVASLVAQGLGVSVVPELTLFHFERAGLARVPVRDPSLVRPIVLARRKGKALSSAAQAMADEIVRQPRAK
ncbi:LysR family transcriptional regulator [Ramlibacter rhizophilus]|uniref:LysR family transcriptional regulator n=1 Tax=Ramlibacter rhizophilus TaxID=1781167 RepID=A0A4Z0BHQ5_9BURK|nr:LysR family transcriptional regulator [Ramlibacter rhizophilus]TFY97797.1 LysR family transcriptional regulator [Ramlibacter rhizophilus]